MIGSALKQIFVVGSIVAFSLPLAMATADAQPYPGTMLPNAGPVRLDKPNGRAGSMYTNNGKVYSAQAISPDQSVRIIVSFKARPLATYQSKNSSLQKASVASIYSSLQSSHASFRTALDTLSHQLSRQSTSDYSYTISHEYYRALNGLALQCKRGMIAGIRALPMVSSVSIDGEVKADLQESIHQIRADVVRDSLGYTGKGVVVGEVDTGIDYENPALGGGFGPGFRVIGGYNFSGFDNDPRDDNGHGTHVAGIIGANGGDTLRGVAPDVKFLAVKVLDANGSGWMSNVIAGIEYCLDPDNNPQTDDAVDIMNMSLGADASSENPVDSAVDNASKAGVLSVVAAGNSGAAGYGSIGSPGTSESALTVGACDSVDRIALFSSLGPDPIHSFMKPEVVAPGVDILSTVLDNQTASWSGTSMATPHVTGIAALLKQEHPLWPPEKIKAAIVNGAHSVGDSISVFAQGKGCVDALAAAEARLVVEPGVMSFGYVDLARDPWSDTVRLTVRNFRSVPQNIHVSTMEGPPPGAVLAFDKTSFALAAGEETTILAVLTVPSSVPVVSTDPFAYVGRVTVASDSDNVDIPFSFIKATTLVFTFDITPIEVFLTDEVDGGVKWVFPNPYETGPFRWAVPIKQGHPLYMHTYLWQDSLPMYQPGYIIDRRISNPVGLTYVSVRHTDASIKLQDDSVYDILGSRVDISRGTYSMLIVDSIHRSSSAYSNFVPSYCPLFISPMDGTIFVHLEMAVLHGTDLYAFKKSVHGIERQQDVRFPSGPDNLAGLNFSSTYHNPVVAPKPGYEKFIYVNFELTGPNGGIKNRFGAPFSDGTFYFNGQEINDESGTRSVTYLGAGYDEWDNFPGAPESYEDFPWMMLCTPTFTVNNNKEAVFEKVRKSDLSREFVVEVLRPGDTVRVEDNVHLSFPSFNSYVQGDNLYSIDLDCNPLYWGQDGSGGTISSDGSYEEDSFFYPYWNLPRFTALTFARNRSQTNTKPYTSWNFQQHYFGANDYTTNAYAVYKNVKKNAGVYRVLGNASSYSLLGQSGRCTLDYEYRMPDPASWPTGRVLFPSFRFLQVAVDGKPVDAVRPDQTGTIRLILFDPDSAITSTDLSLLLASGEEISLPLTYAGGQEYDATIPSYLPTGFVDVVARAEDAKGNSIELTASPACYFGSGTENAKPDARLTMCSYDLKNVDSVAFVPGDTLKYDLTYINYGSDLARSVVVAFPTTPFFRPVGSSTWTADTLGVNDTVRVPLRLVFLGKQQSTEDYTHYAPSVTWTSGGTSYLRTHKVLVDLRSPVTGIVPTDGVIPGTFALYQNYPNPFNPSTTIRYDVPKTARVKLVVYDILGRQVATLVDEVKAAGRYQSTWHTSRLASGVYFYRLNAGDYGATRKLVLLK